jgi:hypothetical protein
MHALHFLHPVLHVMHDRLRRIDLNLLLVFDALFRHRSVVSAAEELCLSSSACSHALSRLRSALGDELFVRFGNGMQPTARAEQIRTRVARLPCGRLRGRGPEGAPPNQKKAIASSVPRGATRRCHPMERRGQRCRRDAAKVGACSRRSRAIAERDGRPVHRCQFSAPDHVTSTGGATTGGRDPANNLPCAVRYPSLHTQGVLLYATFRVARAPLDA